MKKEMTLLLQSNNIIEVDQIVHALALEHIEAEVKGRKALEVGNVELTGITGASIFVNSDQINEAKQVLVSMGLDYDGPRMRDSGITYAYIALFVLLGLMILTMIIIAVK